MILSDGEIRQALKNKSIIIDPPPEPSQYNTSAVDLLLGPQLYSLKTIEDIQQRHLAGVEMSIVVDPSTVKIGDLLQKYAVMMPQEPDGSFVLRPHQFALGQTREYSN